ncbi:MAG TPA: APC family permease [Opitutaceae bacterium]|jgi:amino acid transporter|nr:APC family permease [Opitutaceae bacterium]
MAEAQTKSQPGVVLRGNYLNSLENVAQSIGTMGPVATIGTVLPLLIYKSGNGTWLLFLGILGAFCLISTSINVFASRYATAGSLSAFAEIGLGKWAGSLTGWSYIVAMAFVVISSAVSSAFYLSMVVTHFTHQPVGVLGSVLLTVLVVAAAWWPAHQDIKLSTKIMLAVELVSVIAILFIMGLAMYRSHHWADHAQAGLEGVSFSGMKLGFILAFMLLAGFESTTTLGEEAKAATHTLPRVMFLCIVPVGILFIGSLYCLTALSHSQNLALDQSDAPLDMIAQSLGLPTLGLLSSAGVAFSCFGCALGGFNAGSRVIFSMARSRHIWRYFEAIHPVNGTPSRAVALLGWLSVIVPSAMIASGVKMADAIDYLIQIASFGFLGGYLAVCIAAPVFLARKFKLGIARIAVAVLSIAVLGAALFLSIFPIPDAPWRYLPYIFVGMLALGMTLSWSLGRARPGTA